MMLVDIQEHYLLLITVLSASSRFSSKISESICKTSKPLKQFRKTLKEIRKLLRAFKGRKK